MYGVHSYLNLIYPRLSIYPYNLNFNLSFNWTTVDRHIIMMFLISLSCLRMRFIIFFSKIKPIMNTKSSFQKLFHFLYFWPIGFLAAWNIIIDTFGEIMKFFYHEIKTTFRQWLVKLRIIIKVKIFDTTRLGACDLRYNQCTWLTKTSFDHSFFNQ